MAQYKSTPVTVRRSVAEINDRFADLSSFQSAIDALPAEERAKIGDVRFDKTSIAIKQPQFGEIKFQVKTNNPGCIEMEAVGLPLPLNLIVDLLAVDVDTTQVTSSIDVEIPAMLRPLIGGTMQKAVDQFGSLIAKLNA